MPTGARGIMMAVMLAALMSDLDSIFNSASTLFTIDIYQRFRAKASTTELMVVGRLFIVVMVVVAVAWVPIIQRTQGGQLFIYIQEISLYLTPQVAAVYLLAILWPRSNEQGTFWGLMVGLVMGLVRLIMIFVYPGPEACGDPDTRPPFLKDFHYMYYGIVLFWTTALVTCVISLLTNRPEYSKLYRTTYWTRHDKQLRTDQHQDKLFPLSYRLSKACCKLDSAQLDSTVATVAVRSPSPARFSYSEPGSATGHNTETKANDWTVPLGHNNQSYESENSCYSR